MATITEEKLCRFSVPIRRNIERVSYCVGETRAIPGLDTLVVI